MLYQGPASHSGGCTSRDIKDRLQLFLYLPQPEAWTDGREVAGNGIYGAASFGQFRDLAQCSVGLRNRSGHEQPLGA
jgi:hypothetical protein